MSDAGYVPERDRPMVLSGAAEWFSRRPAGVPEGPVELAARVEAALDAADRLMFTVTPRQELDMAARWQLVADQAWCGQLRHVVATTARLSAQDRDFAGDELALALGMSSGAGRTLVWRCGSIAALPGLVEAVESGRLTQRHVSAFMGELDEVELTLEQRQAVALICLARHVDQSPARWAGLVRRLILTVDRAAAKRRREVATDRRRVSFFPHADQQGAIWLQAPVELVAAAQARVAAEARRLKAAGDERSMEQLTCDVAPELLTHGVVAGQPVTSWDVQVISPQTVLEGGDLELAEIPGFGPLLALTARENDNPIWPQAITTAPSGATSGCHSHARELAEQAGAFTQVAVSQDGHVIAVSDQVRADTLRDAETDAGAGSGGVAGQGVQERHAPNDLAPAPASSPEALTPVGSDDFLTRAIIEMRLECLCRHHHRAKHAIFTVLADPDGTIIWITRGGWVFRRPQGY